MNGLSDELAGLRYVGATHPVVKRALALGRAADQTGNRVLVEGMWAHEVVLASGASIETFLVCPERIWSEVAKTLAGAGVANADESFQISARTMQRFSVRDRSDGMVSVIRLPRWALDDVSLGKQALVVVADGLETPGNLGTLVRTCDAGGVDMLIATDRRTPVAHPKVFRAAHGTTLSVPIVEVDDTAQLVRWLQRRCFRVLLADAPGDAARSDTPSTEYRAADWSGRVAIVVGNERYGISSAWRSHDFDQVVIPMHGQVNNLNVAVAGSLLIFEARAHQSRTTS